MVKYLSFLFYKLVGILVMLLNYIHDIPESNLYYISGYSGSIITTYFQSKYDFSDITQRMHNATHFNKNVTSWGMCKRL